MLEVTRSLPRRRLSVSSAEVNCLVYQLTAADDAATAARKLRGDYPGQDKEAKKAGEEGYEAVRASAQQYVCSMRFHPCYLWQYIDHG